VKLGRAQLNNIAHFTSKRCPVTHLTKLQVCALANVCIGMAESMPNGVYRSLVIRGLLTGTHTLTADGREALARCTVLSNQFRESLLAMPIAPRTATIGKAGDREVEPSRLRSSDGWVAPD